MDLIRLVTMVAAVNIAVSTSGNATHVEELTGMLKKIKDASTITPGVRGLSIPFSCNVNGVCTTGYSCDATTKVTKNVKRQLGLKDLKVSEVPAAS